MSVGVMMLTIMQLLSTRADTQIRFQYRRILRCRSFLKWKHSFLPCFQANLQTRWMPIISSTSHSSCSWYRHWSSWSRRSINAHGRPGVKAVTSVELIQLQVGRYSSIIMLSSTACCVSVTPVKQQEGLDEDRWRMCWSAERCRCTDHNAVSYSHYTPLVFREARLGSYFQTLPAALCSG